MKISLLFLMICVSLAGTGFAQQFAGSFEGNQANLPSSSTLKVLGTKLSGTILINGRPGNVSGNIKGNNASGLLYDIEMKKNYSFTCKLKKDTLQYDIVFPELNNQVVQLIMLRNKVLTTTNTKGTKSPALIGVWRYTETINSGSGDTYASFSTDYFMDFRGDGTVYSWTGKSAGGMGGMSIEGNASAKEKGGWYTKDKTLFLIDPASGKQSSVLFYAEPNRIMLHNGGANKKVMTRVR